MVSVTNYVKWVDGVADIVSITHDDSKGRYALLSQHFEVYRVVHRRAKKCIGRLPGGREINVSRLSTLLS